MFTPSASTLLAPLVSWFAEQGRLLPWRARDLDGPHPDPYAVLVSELMLQQTQVATVIPYFERWMARFPDIRALARAQDDEVHKQWEGLGYYRRARFLKESARIIAASGWPLDLAGLQALPGLGSYTAAAVASIAFQIPEPALDGNAFRVLARLLGLQEDPKRRAIEIRTWLRPALEALGPSRLTQSLMELGATACSPRPHCEACPLAHGCLALRMGAVDRIPPKVQRKEPTVLGLWLVALEAEDHWLLHPPTKSGMLAGLWCWPSLPREAAAMGVSAAEGIVPYGAIEIRSWRGWTQTYSHRKELVEPASIRLPERPQAPESAQWIPARDLATLPLGKRDQRLRGLLSQASDPGAERVPAMDLVRRVLHP